MDRVSGLLLLLLSFFSIILSNIYFTDGLIFSGNSVNADPFSRFPDCDQGLRSLF